MKYLTRTLISIVSLILFFFSANAQNRSFQDSPKNKSFTFSYGGIIRGDTTKKEIAIVFTGDSFGEGANYITKVLKDESIKASFFFTGNFYRNKNFENAINKLISDNHYLGAHSDNHLLYCDWENRDSTLISHEEFIEDLSNNYREMEKYGISKNEAEYFLPPFEWYNDTISKWTGDFGLTLIDFTPGTKSNADYTTPDMKNYISSKDIYKNILDYETLHKRGLNGFILLIHFGTSPEREDKFYFYLQDLISELKKRNYSFKRIDELLK